jgi:hypothetical protein
VDGTPWEDGDGASRDVVEDEASTVLGKHTRAKGAVDGNVDFSGTRVSVGDVQTTGAQDTVSHGHAITDDGGEIPRVSGGDHTIGTGRRPSTGQEVEDELIITQNVDPLHI